MYSFVSVQKSLFSFLRPSNPVVALGLDIIVGPWVACLHSPGIFVFRSIIYKRRFVHGESFCYQFNLFYKFGSQQVYVLSLLTKHTHIPVPSKKQVPISSKVGFATNLLKKFSVALISPQSIVYFHHFIRFTLSQIHY